jgi:hypothetical protein
MKRRPSKRIRPRRAPTAVPVTPSASVPPPTRAGVPPVPLPGAIARDLAAFGELVGKVMDKSWSGASFNPPPAPRPDGQPRYRLAVPLTGHNIGTLIEACGWNFTKAARETQIDRTNIKDHVNGKATPIKATLEIYAGVFSTVLKRHGLTVTAEELQTRDFSTDPAITRILSK